MQRMLSFLIGIILGGLVGATLSLLFAPMSGDELRFQMQERAQMLQDEVKSAAAERRAELEAQLAQLRTPRIPTSKADLEQPPANTVP